MKKKYEIYIDNNDRLVVAEFKNPDAEFESNILKGSDTYSLINKLSLSEIIDIYEEKNNFDVILEYKNYIIRLNDYRKILKKRGMSPISKNLNNYYQKENQANFKLKKVKRKNKYVGSKIIASGLTLVILGCCAHGMLSINNDQPLEMREHPSSYEIIVDTKEKPNNEIVIMDLITDDNEQKNEEITQVSIDYEDRSETKKAYMTKSYYGDMIAKYAKMYGVDPVLVTAIATQERGIHSTKTDVGGATGLMQIQNSVWIGEKVSAYNFVTKQNESFTVTLNKIQDIEYNIKIGCMILQNALQYMDYNILAAIQCYNMGYGNMMKILNKYSFEANKSISKILCDSTDTGWFDYRKNITQGDQMYIEHVLSWIGEEAKICVEKKDSVPINMNIDNKTSIKRYIN